MAFTRWPRRCLPAPGAASALRGIGGDAIMATPGGAGTCRLGHRRRLVLPPTRPTGLALGRRLSHRIGCALGALARPLEHAFTGPLRVLYRGSVARDRRGCDHGFLLWCGRTF